MQREEAFFLTDKMKETLEKPSNKAFYCPYCKRLTISPGNIKDGIIMCAICASFERQRFLYFVYDDFFFNTEKPLKILHFAPEKSIYNTICSNKNIDYVCCDLNPENFPFVEKIQREDGMHLSFNDKTFDFIIHNHILEHVPNDRDFIQETLRVLKNDGKIIASFPYAPDKLSDETIVDPVERAKQYGQEDHVRLYGSDFMEKLTGTNYNIEIINTNEYLTPKELAYIKGERLDDMFIMLYNQ